MNQELIGALFLVQNFQKLTEIQSSEVFRFSRELSGEGVQVLYSVVLWVLPEHWFISTLTMIYSAVLVHLSTGSVVLVFYDLQIYCTALPCPQILLSTSKSQYWSCTLDFF
jgi:hypothetical protein